MQREASVGGGHVAEERWVYETERIVSEIRQLDPERVADAARRINSDEVAGHIDAVRRIVEWYAKYADALTGG